MEATPARFGFVLEEYLDSVGPPQHRSYRFPAFGSDSAHFRAVADVLDHQSRRFLFWVPKKKWILDLDDLAL